MRKEKWRQLKNNIWFYFIIFAIVILVTVWLFQVVLLESFYRRNKKILITQTGNEFVKQINEDNLIDFNDKAITAMGNGIMTYIVGVEYDSSGIISDCDFLYPTEQLIFNSKENKDFFVSVINSVGEIAKKRSVSDIYNNTHLFYLSKINYGETESYLFLTISLSSIKESVNVVQSQLLSVSIIIIIIAFFMSMYLSTKLTKPISDMAKTAKRWAGGDQKVEFEMSNYTELAELAEALNYAKEEISKTGELQRDLLANVSHDLKTPLTMIKAYAEMIRDLYGDNKAKREESTKVIIDEVDRLTMLVNDILDLSKLQTAGDDLDLKPVNISELTELVIYRFANFMNASGYKIEEDIEADLFTLVDEEKISQVIYNLLGNSLNYTGENKIVKVYLKKKEDCILLEIIDSGSGISKDKIDTIWEKYYRFADTHKRPVKGTGLGLSIVKTILDSHGLKYGVISKKEIGSNFFVEFKVLNDER